MSSGNSTGLVTALTATAGLVAAVLGIVKYFNYRTKRDRIAAVGTAFEAVVEALASDDDVKRMAAAIRLRRFFDPRGELATGGLWPRLPQLRAREGHQAEQATNQDATAGTTEGTPRHRGRFWKLTRDELPYAADALNVIVAILREQPPGNFQKLLADALTKAPKELLAGADIQKANLQNAWLGQIDLPEADFYRADLSDASFKEATAQGVKFYEARLARTRFVRAKLQEGNFFGADLPRAEFTDAVLTRAKFDQARATRALFRGAQLQGANFTDADVREADFSGADLAGRCSLVRGSRRLGSAAPSMCPTRSGASSATTASTPTTPTARGSHARSSSASRRCSRWSSRSWWTGSRTSSSRVRSMWCGYGGRSIRPPGRLVSYGG